jgi:decaprenylphospho-beta-D-erythro-pentofuranosid-2-ulose 2-reductase
MREMPSTQGPVLILGAGSDIAAAVAREFAALGHPIQLAVRSANDFKPLKCDIEVRYQVSVSLHEFDALDLRGHDRFMAALPAPPHVVVCAVGMLGEAGDQGGDLEKMELVMRSNYLGPALAMQAAAKVLAGIDGPTALIGFSSVAGDRGRASNYVYGSAKAGFSAFLSGLRQNLSGTGVLVITVKPGFVHTRMTEGMALPGLLTSSPEGIARLVMLALKRGRMIVYPFPWRMIMSVVKCLPEIVFKRLRF